MKAASSTALLELSLYSVPGWKKRLGVQNSSCQGEAKAYLEGSQQLAAALDAGNVKKQVDGPGSDFRPVLGVSLDSIQDLLLVLVSTHLAWKSKKSQGRNYEGEKPTWEGNSERSTGIPSLCPESTFSPE